MFWKGSCSPPVLLFVLLSLGQSRHLQWAPDKRMRTKIFYQMEVWFCLAHKNCTRAETVHCSTCASIRYSRKRKYISQRTRLTDPVPTLSTRMPSPRVRGGCQSHSAHTPCPPLPHPPVMHTPRLTANVPHTAQVFLSLWVCSILKERFRN